MLRPAALRLKSLASSLGSLSSLRDPSTSKRIYKRNGIIVDAVPDAYHSAADAQTPYAFRKALKVPNGEHGHNITKDPLYNKGSAFEHGERDRLGLCGRDGALCEDRDLSFPWVLVHWLSRGRQPALRATLLLIFHPRSLHTLKTGATLENSERPSGRSILYTAGGGGGI